MADKLLDIRELGAALGGFSACITILLEGYNQIGKTIDTLDAKHAATLVEVKNIYEKYSTSMSDELKKVVHAALDLGTLIMYIKERVDKSNNVNKEVMRLIQNHLPIPPNTEEVH